MSDVRLCMIGAGHHASRLVYSCFPLLKNAQVVANADLDEERATSIARHYGIQRSYSDYWQMIETEKPDGVLICVGADFHARTAIELLETGYHVYTEKPPAMNLEQCRAIQKSQRHSGKVYMTAFKKRFAPAYQKAKAVIDSKEFGKPELLTITRTSGNWREGADSVNEYLRENAIHVVDLASFLFGPVRSVAATSHSVATVAITLDFAYGVGTLAVTDRMSYARGWEVVTAVGSAGVCIQVDNSVEMNAWKFDRPIAAHKPEFVAGTSHSSIEQGFVGELQAFVDAIQSGSQPDANIETTTHIGDIKSYRAVTGEWPSRRRGDDSMKIGISRISETRDEAYEVLAAARRYGFEGVQLKPSQYEEFLKCPAAFVERYGELAALACGGLIVYPGNDPTTWVEKLEGVLPFAVAVKANHICLCCGVYATGASEEEVRAVADVLTMIGERTRQQGLMISIHNHANSLIETEEDIARLMSLLDPALCGLTLDTAHAAKSGITDVSRLVSRFQNHLLNVHLKDLSADGKFCALGRGALSLGPILQTLESIKYDQWLIVDEETGSMKTEAAFAIAAEYLRQKKFYIHDLIDCSHV